MNDEADDNDQDRLSAQHTASAGVASSTTTTVIPVHCDNYNNEHDDDLPRWTLIEVNGELLPPKEMTLSTPTSTTTTTLECELGCIWLDQDDAGKIVRFSFFSHALLYRLFFAHLLALSLSHFPIPTTKNYTGTGADYWFARIARKYRATRPTLLHFGKAASGGRG
jgi:hypothetical protein